MPDQPSHAPQLRRMVFGSLSGVDTPKMIADRLRAAIGVGLLDEGDPLPPEAELARQFDVTAFSLRAALAVLREEGLIHTRAGRKGGSFVKRSPGLAATAARDQLVALSATDLRDLDDWRAMLAGTSAYLAARRGSASNAARLAQLADRVRTADEASEARRVHSRFHVELAAAAQSTRMSSAELRMYREFDWLIALLLVDKRQRITSARQLRRIADAVAQQDCDSARRLAENYSHHVVDVVMQMRLSAIAGQDHEGSTRTGPSAGTPQPTVVAAAIWKLVDQILDELRDVADACARTLADSPTAAALAEMGRLTRATLQNTTSPLHGLGVMADENAIPGHNVWSTWWIRPDGDTIEPYDHVIDPGRDDRYEYFDAPWMAQPRQTGEATVIGPYVDYGGTDEYTVTLAHPILVRDSFVGVAAADVLVTTLEQRWAAELTSLQRPCAIINGEGRVVMASTGRYPVGELVRSNRGRRIACGPRGWALLIGRSR